MNRNEVMLGLSNEEAKALRTALHIATRLCFVLPDGLNHKKWGAKFEELHDSLVHNNVGILDGARNFSGKIIAEVKRESSPLVSADFSEPKLWKVQFDYGPPPSADWRDIRTLGEFTSRNQAYRAMRERMRVRSGYTPSVYRVVPNDTPEGREKDRGFYTVQFKSYSSREWDTSVRTGLSGTFVSAEHAKAALDSAYPATTRNKRALLLRYYRIKWHQGKP
jgi:hypothetical protein